MFISSNIAFLIPSQPPQQNPHDFQKISELLLVLREALSKSLQIYQKSLNNTDKPQSKQDSHKLTSICEEDSRHKKALEKLQTAEKSKLKQQIVSEEDKKQSSEFLQTNKKENIKGEGFKEQKFSQQNNNDETGKVYKLRKRNNKCAKYYEQEPIETFRRLKEPTSSLVLPNLGCLSVRKIHRKKLRLLRRKFRDHLFSEDGVDF